MNTKIKRITFFVVLCSGLLILSACSSLQAGGGDLTGKVWVLSELAGKSPVTGSTITALFTADGKVGGSSGCNTYSGTYETSGKNITFSSSMASTMMMCEQALMDQESSYLNVLSEAKTFSVKGDQLTLFDEGKSSLAVYKAQSQDLSGTSWEAVGYNNGKQAVTSVMAGTSLTAEFGSDGTLSGKSGCNTFNGSYKTDGNNITIGPLASTRMFCGEPEGVMDQEALYLAALQSAVTFRIEGNKLELRTGDGSLAADFTKK